MFYLIVFSIDINKSATLTTSFLSVIFHDLRMAQFWYVKYICPVYKLKLLLWTYPTFWAIFMAELWLLYLELLNLEL